MCLLHGKDIRELGEWERRDPLGFTFHMEALDALLRSVGLKPDA